MPADRNDREVRRFVAGKPAETFSGIAEAIAAKFGAERAWPAELVSEVWRELHPPRTGPRNRYAEDREMMTFIADRADLVTLDELRAAGLAKFGRKAFPSRSQLYRLVLEVREAHSNATAPVRG